MTQEADNLLPFSCFEIDTTTAEYNAVLEFFFSATINSSPEGVKATKVSLRKDGVVVAVAVAEEDDEGGPLASNFSIFYKELVPAMSVFAFDI